MYLVDNIIVNMLQTHYLQQLIIDFRSLMLAL